MVLFRIKISFLLLLLSLSLFSSENDLEEIYNNILISYSAIKTYKADFAQENYWNELEVHKKSYGKMYYDTECFLLDYTEPEGQKLLLTTDDITIYDSASKQIMISNDIQTELRPDKFISRYWDVSKKEVVEHNGNEIRIKLLTPDKECIHIHIVDFYIVDFLIIDESLNSVSYTFFSEEKNIVLPDDIFKLTIPDDFNVLDTRNR